MQLNDNIKKNVVKYVQAGAKPQHNISVYEGWLKVHCARITGYPGWN